MPRQPRIPSYRLHKPTGQAVVTINGKDFYLGRHNCPQSQAAYKRLIAAWLANHKLDPGPVSSSLSVDELLLAYLRFAEGYYRKNEKVTTQIARIKSALRPVRKLYGTTPAREFGPLGLKAVPPVMIEAEWSRNFINSCVGCIKRVWKWARSEEMVPPEIYHRLQSVEGLRRGRSKAKRLRRPFFGFRGILPSRPPPLSFIVR